MKKLVLILSLLIIMGLGTQTAFAQGNNNGDPKSNNAQHQKFNDTKDHWAENAIDKVQQYGFIKGYEDGTFKPNKPVTEIEAIVMVVRAMDLEDDAQDAEVGTLVSSMVQMPAWADGYLQVALDNDVITATELLSFSPNQGAKRILVALWLSRAVDLDGYVDEDTELPFLDKGDIPDDLYDAAVLMYEAGLMKGDGHNLQPNKPITRAEMSVLIDRIDESDADVINFTDFRGIITNVDEDSITVERWDISKTFDFAGDVTIKLDGEKADVDDLKDGYRVRVTLNSDAEVIEVKAATPDKDEEEDANQYEGKISNIDINEDGDDYITIKQGYHSYTFMVDSDTKITLDGDNAHLEDLENGWTAKIDFENGVATKISVESDEEYAEYEGTIIDIDDEQIEIEDEDGNNYTFDVTDDTKITLDDLEVDLDELEEGYEVEIKADDDTAVTIDAERN